MLKKLFKYDMKWILKFMLPFLGITIISSLFNRLFFELKSVNFIFNILYFTTTVVTNGLIVNLIFNIIIRNIIRFKSQIYGDESYLIHTLPVKRSDIVISKILSSSLSLLISVFVGVVCLLIEYLTKDSFNILKNTLEGISVSYNISKVLIIVLIIIYVVTMIIWVTEMIYTSIILGYRSSDKKALKSIIYGVIIYILMELFNLIVLGLLAIFNKDVLNILKTNVMTPGVFKIIIILFLSLSIIYTIVFFITNIKFINKKLNID